MTRERAYPISHRFSLSRRHALRLSAAAALAAACAAPQPTSGPPSGGQATTQPAGQAQPQAATPTRGGRLFFRVPGDPVAFDPHATISYLTVQFLDFFHAKLTRYDYRTTPPYRNGDESRIIGELAESWEAPEPEPRTWIFRLKRGMKFHNKEPVNGREVVADDVKWSFERALAPTSSVEEWAWNNYDKIEVVDRYTVKFTLKQPNARLPIDVSCYQAWVLPREADEKIGFKKVEGATIGAGPWILDSYQPGSKWVAKRNPEYGPFPGKPNADEMHALIIQTQDGYTTAFRARQVFAHSPLPQEVASIKASNPEVRWNENFFLATNTWMLAMNVQERPFNDVRVRRAVSLAIDRQAWLRSPNLKAGKIESGPVTWGMGDWKLDPDKHGEAGQWFQYDVAKAKQLLAAAGYPNGFEVTMVQTPQYGASYMTEAELLQEFLSKVGIKVNIQNVEYSQWITQQYLGKYSGLFWGPDNLDRLTQQFLSRYASWSSRNHPNVRDPDVDRRLAQWRAITDTQKAKEYAWDMQKFFADQCYCVFRPQPYSYVAWHPFLKNYEGQPEFYYDYGFRWAFLWTDPVQGG